jgi:hypothetical protein
MTKPLFVDLIAQLPGLVDELRSQEKAFDLGFQAGVASMQSEPNMPVQLAEAAIDAAAEIHATGTDEHERYICTTADLKAIINELGFRSPPAQSVSVQKPSDMDLQKCWVEKPDGTIDGIASMRLVLQTYGMATQLSVPEGWKLVSPSNSVS